MRIAPTSAPTPEQRTPLRFSIGDGTPRIDVHVTVLDETGARVHSGFVPRIASHGIYVWTPPVDATPGPYSVRWQGTKAAPGQITDLRF